MSYLSQLPPAAALMILNGRNVGLKELLKITFLDLLFKKVLKIVERESQSNQRDPVRVYSYVQIGENFYSYAPMAHERVFLDLFSNITTQDGADNLEILFRGIVKIAFQEAKSVVAYKRLIIEAKGIREYYKSNVMLMYLGGFFLNKSGEDVRFAIRNEISEMEKELDNGVKTNPIKVRELLQILGAAVMLLEPDVNSLLALNKEFSDHANIQAFAENEGGLFTGGGFDFYSNFSGTFDNSCGGGCSGHSSCSGHSGCGGGHGCSSGCSGCGGGGCGGCSS